MTRTLRKTNHRVNGHILEKDGTWCEQRTLGRAGRIYPHKNQTFNTGDRNDFVIWFDINFFLKHTLFTVISRSPGSSVD